MGDFIKTQNSFANGEVSPEFFARDGINGLARMRNMDVIAGGGLRRRRGLRHITYLNDVARLVAFSAGEADDYILALGDGRISMYDPSGVRVATLVSPWPMSAISRLQWAQRFGTMIFVHPEYRPYTLTRNAAGVFELRKFVFASNDATMESYAPFMKFDDAADVKLTIKAVSGKTGYATITASRDFWDASRVGSAIRAMNKQWDIVEYTSPTVVTAVTNGTFTATTNAISDWTEEAFSSTRGWPCSISFHQDRLVFGGTPAWPSGVWMSRVGKHTNFDVGTGLDDEAIFITLLSSRRQQICTVVSSDNLQILTTDGEWAISSKPLTPSVVDIKQHTDVGSVAARYLPPQKIEGQTVFISGSERDIRELSLDELGEKYNANDLCALSKHLMSGPIDVAYNQQTRQLFVVMADGDIAVLNHNSALGISAWGLYETAGLFRSVVVCADKTFVAVKRDNAVALEVFDDTAIRDADKYDFEFTASALPLRASGHQPSRLRIRKITARVLDTKALNINGVSAHLPNEIYDASSSGYSGDVSIGYLGSADDVMASPWTIGGDMPMPATVLSVTIHGRYSV